MAYRSIIKEISEYNHLFGEKRFLAVDLYPKIKKMFPEINSDMMTNLLLQDSAMDKQKIMDDVYVKKRVNDTLAFVESHGTAELKMKIFPSFSLL